MLLPAPAARDPLLGRLKADGIHAVFHYVPLHSSPIGRKLGCAAPCRSPATWPPAWCACPMDNERTKEAQRRVVEDPTARLPGTRKTVALKGLDQEKSDNSQQWASES